MSTAQLSTDGLHVPMREAIATFINSISGLDREQKDDLFTVMAELETCKEPEEFQEIAEAVLEIISPADAGPLKKGAGEESKEGENQVQVWSRSVGKKIRRLRLAIEWNQKQLADATGLTQSHISRLELGLHSPSNRTVAAIAKALGVDPHDIDPGFQR